MIEIVDGVGVGSGKSFYVMTRCLAHFLRGGTVYSSDSFELLFENIKQLALDRYGLVLEDRQYKQVPADAIMRLHESTPPGTDDCPVLIVVDEAQDHFDVRDHADKNKRAFFSWCTQSRHDNNDLIFITQDANNIDARFRRLATYRITVRNTVSWKIPGFGSFASIIRLATFGTNSGRYFAVHTYDRDGRTLFERKWVKQDPALFALYVSKSMQLKHKRSGLPVGKIELKRVGSRSPMLKYFVFGLLLFFGGAAIYVGKLVYNGELFGMPSAEKHAAVKSVPEVTGGSRSRASAEKKAEFEVVKEELRGVVSFGDGRSSLRTTEGQYLEGAMSAQGYVVGVDLDGRVALCHRGDGMRVYVVGVDRSIEVEASGPGRSADTSRPTPTPEPETAKPRKMGYLGYGESIATGHGGPEHLDYAQRIVTGAEDRQGASAKDPVASGRAGLSKGPL